MRASCARQIARSAAGCALTTAISSSSPICRSGCGGIRPRLAEAVEIIRRDWNDDPGQYVRTELKVAETAYGSWPAAIRRLFEPARTVETGKPTYRIEPAGKEAA